jgi:hypothetical protein
VNFHQHRTCASFLQQPKLHLHVSVLQQTVPSLNVIVLQQSLLPLDGCQFLSFLQQPVQPLNVSFLYQSVVSLNLSVFLFYSSLYCPRSCLACSRLCFTWTYLFNSRLCCARRCMVYSTTPGRVYLKELLIFAAPGV